eukprot:g4452.t1
MLIKPDGGSVKSFSLLPVFAGFCHSKLRSTFVTFDHYFLVSSRGVKSLLPNGLCEEAKLDGLLGYFALFTPSPKLAKNEPILTKTHERRFVERVLQMTEDHEISKINICHFYQYFLVSS